MRRDWFVGWVLIGGTMLMVAAACAVTMAVTGGGEPGLRAVVRLTARISAVLFSVTFAASAINRLWGGSVGRWLLRHRRYLGLSFASSHAFHLGALVALGQQLDDPFLLAESGIGGVAGGGFGYLVLTVMVATSSDRAVSWLGQRRWKRIHRFGMYVLFAIFAFTYVGRLVENGGPTYVVLAALVVAPLGLRLAARVSRRHRLA